MCHAFKPSDKRASRQPFILRARCTLHDSARTPATYADALPLEGGRLLGRVEDHADSDARLWSLGASGRWSRSSSRFQLPAVETMKPHSSPVRHPPAPPHPHEHISMSIGVCSAPNRGMIACPRCHDDVCVSLRCAGTGVQVFWFSAVRIGGVALLM